MGILKLGWGFFTRFGCTRYPHLLPRYQKRAYVSESSTTNTTRDIFSEPGSLFSSDQSAWDQVFNHVAEKPPLVPLTRRGDFRKFPQQNSAGRTRRQSMTAREISAFDEMFNMIFNAVSASKKASTSSHGTPDPSKSRADAQATVGIGRGDHRILDLFGKLRRHSRGLRWTSEVDEQLDRKQEEMDLCDTDQQLLDWALREVFGESRRYEEAVQRAIAEAAKTGNPPSELPVLQPVTYPHLIARLMRAFRDKHHDPHLALSVFDHARHLSVASYVCGCTTAAYNELLETRWRCFRDLRGVHDALEEMAINGIAPDTRTRSIAEAVRLEVAAPSLWEAGSEADDPTRDEVLQMLNKIESLVARRTSRISAGRNSATNSTTSSTSRKATGNQRKWSNDQDWKVSLHQSQPQDSWGFDVWEDKRDRPRRSSSITERRRPVENDRNVL